MATSRTASSIGLTKPEIFICELAFEGLPDGEIAKRVYGTCIGQDDYKKKLNKVRATLRKPEVQERFREMVRERALIEVGHGLKKLREQTENESGWLANKATNDLLNRMWPMVMGEEDKSVVVKIEGMPQLGTPDQEEE
jgi:hypothetical protein